MEHNSSKFLKPFCIVIIASLMLSFTFQGNGVMAAQARSPQGVEKIADGTPAPQGDQSGPLHIPDKGSLERLTSLVNASVTNAPDAKDTAYLKKLDSHLQDTVSARLSGEDVTKTAKANSLRISDTQAVLMDVYVNGPLDQAVNKLKGLGMQVLASNHSLGKVVEGYLPVDSVLPAAKLDFTKAFLPVMGVVTDTGSVVSQGDAAHNGPAARALGTTGAGVVVGVISDSMNQVGSKVAGSQATGDLPASVTVLSDDPTGEDEGRAMGEIIYDTAPGITSMYFSTGTTGPASKAASINNLVAHGVKVIADDVAYFGEPFFQDGQIAQAVDSAHAAGVAYFASAGNQARQSYESSFRPLWYYGTWHDFDPGPGTNMTQSITTVPNGGCINIALQWDDPWGAATHDFDFYLDDMDGTVASSRSDNLVTGLPFEFVHWCNGTGSAQEVSDRILEYAGSDTAFLKYIAYGDFDVFTINDWNSNSETIGPDAASASGAMAVAAVNWNDSGLNDPEPYSSRGPSITRFFDTSGVRLGSPDVRLKPNIAGADCVATSHNWPGGVGFSEGTFCGTSAAAPSVAGVTALVWSANPSLTLGGLYSILGNSANTNDCTLAGNPDADCGYGFILADRAVTAAASFPTTLTVNKTGTGSGTVTSDLPGIDCGLTCSHDFAYNTMVTLTAAASTGSTFTGWSGVSCPGTGTCAVTMSGAKSVTANFNITTYTLSVSKTGTGFGTVTSDVSGINCGATCSHDFTHDTVVTLSASPTGSTFNGWSGGGCSGTGTCVVTMTAAQSVTADFTVNSYTLTVNRTGTGSGTVTSDPTGIDCGLTCAYDFNYNTPVTLTAAASTGSTFTGWSGDCSGTGTCHVTISGTASVTAHFTLNTYSLSVSKTGTGSGTVTSDLPGINCGATCSHAFDYNTVVTLSAAASTGSTFSGWSGSGCSGTDTCVVTMTVARSVTANFTINTYTLTVNKTGYGLGTVTSSPVGIACGATCSYAFNYNTAVTLSAAASTGSTFTGWSGGGCAGTGTCVVTMSTGQSVAANFNPPAPAKPVLVSPANAALTNDNTPLLSWNSVLYGNTYRVQIATTSNFLTPVQDQPALVVTSYTATTLGDGKYYWRVQAINGNSVAGAFSTARNFTVDTVPPGMPVLTLPVNNAIVHATPVFKWKAVTGAKAYQFDYGNNSNCSGPIYTSPVLTTTTHTPPAMALGTYYWCVKARDAAGNWGDWSTSFTINLHAPIPGKPILISPANGALTSDTTPTLTWGPAANANIYELQLSTSSAFTSPIMYGGISVTTFDVPTALSLGKWYWRVLAINADGDSGLYSSTRNFTIH